VLDLNEVKLWLRLEPSDTTEDAILQSIVVAAEEYLRNALMSWIDPAKNPQAKLLAMALITDMYENRSAVIEDARSAAQASGLRPTIRALLEQLKYAYPQIEPQDFPDVDVGAAVEFHLVARGGSRPYEWSIINGEMPDGLELDHLTGIIAGTPTTAGRKVVTVEVKDAAGRTSSRTAAITVVESS